jgi:hypothetical protein
MKKSQFLFKWLRRKRQSDYGGLFFFIVFNYSTNFWQSIGAVVGLAICSSIFNNRLPIKIMENLEAANTTLSLPPGVPLEIFYQNLAAIRTLLTDPAQQAPIIHGYVQSLSLIFLIDVPFAGMLLITSLFVKKERLPLDQREMVAAA